MQLHAIRTGSVRVKAAQVSGRGHGLSRLAAPLLDGEWADWLPTYAWAIEHREGIIVVDTGAACDLRSLPGWHPYFRFAVQFDIEPEQEIGPQLSSLGISPRDVKTVVLTHLHIDHDAGLRHLPAATVFADEQEIARAAGLRGRMLGYLPDRWPNTFDPRPIAFVPVPFGPFAMSCRLTSAGDVLAVPTPGHTPHHVSVVVLDEDEAIVLAGDCSYTEQNMLDGRIDGISPDEAVALETLTKMRRLASERATVYLPTHDPLSAQRLVDRQVVSIDAGASK